MGETRERREREREGRAIMKRVELCPEEDRQAT